jgi:hypothetical protein
MRASLRIPSLFLFFFIILAVASSLDRDEEEHLSHANREGKDSSSSSSTSSLADQRSLLDVFGDEAKRFLTTRVVKSTDDECKWNWRAARCEPNCDCMLRYIVGDYHLGRMCRLREGASVGEVSG